MDYSAYKDMLIDVAECIDDSTLERMKFRCGDIIKTRENEEIKTPLQLFTALEKRELLDVHKTEFLKDLLGKCAVGKVDGLRLVERYECRLRNGLNFQETPIQQVIYVSAADLPRPFQNRPAPQIHGSNYEGPDLSEEIIFLSRTLGTHWKFFMRALGILEDDIDAIVSDYTTTRERIYQCLLLWLFQEQQGASRRKLVEALRKETIGRNDLALNIEMGQMT